MNPRTPLAALLLPLAAAPALAATTLQATESTAILAVRAFAGVAVADANLPCEPLEFPDEVELCSIEGSLGSFTEPLTGVGPGLRGIAGSATANAADSLWAASMTLSWSTWQTHGWATSGSDLVLSGGGGHSSTLSSSVGGPGVEPGDTGTRQVSVLNLHTLVFTLDAPTAFSFSGSAFGEYLPMQIARLDETGLFSGEGNIPDGFSGTLDAGTYRLRNFHLLQNDFEDEWAYGWNYTLTFHDTVLAVPEAPPLALLSAGLLAIGWRCRHRAGVRA